MAPAQQQRPLRVNTYLRNLRDRDEFRSGVQSPDRFACSYDAPPPLSQRHLFDALRKVESTLKRVVPPTSSGGSSASPANENEPDINEHLVMRPESVSSVGEGTPLAGRAVLADEHDEAFDEVHPLPGPEDIVRTESDQTLALPDHYGRPRRRSTEELGGRTPRQGRSRSRSRVRAAGSSGSRSGSPHVGSAPKKPKAFAFFGHVSLREGAGWETVC